jgi:DNA polymerase-3 subunit alpha
MFIALRNHTTFSLCKGAIKIPDLIEAAKAAKMPALGICDSQNLFAALEFSSACKKAGIQPILGCEMFLKLPDDQNRKNLSNLDIENSLVKLPLIARNNEGYENLMYLVSHSFLYRQSGISPHIDFELLKKNSAGLIALSGGASGFVGKLLAESQEKKLEEFLTQFLEIFPQNFYIEISRTGDEKEKNLEEKFIELAFKKALPLLATNDVYFLKAWMPWKRYLATFPRQLKTRCS